MILHVTEIECRPNRKKGLEYILTGKFEPDNDLVKKFITGVGRVFAIPVKISWENWPRISGELAIGRLLNVTIDRYPSLVTTMHDGYSGKMEMVVYELL